MKERERLLKSRLIKEASCEQRTDFISYMLGIVLSVLVMLDSNDSMVSLFSSYSAVPCSSSLCLWMYFKHPPISSVACCCVAASSSEITLSCVRLCTITSSKRCWSRFILYWQANMKISAMWSPELSKSSDFVYRYSKMCLNACGLMPGSSITDCWLSASPISVELCHVSQSINH